MPAKYFDHRPKFNLMDRPSALICTLLNMGLYGLGSVSVHASKKGLRIALGGHTVATGKTPAELEAAFEAARSKAKAARQAS